MKQFKSNSSSNRTLKFCLLTLGLMVSWYCQTSFSQDPTLTQVGVAKVDITPPEGVPMAGYYHARSAKGVHDPLQSKAIVIESQGSKAVLIALDLITTTPELVKATRELIFQQTKIPSDRVMISATHAHTGPVLRRQSSSDKALGGSSDAAKKYTTELPQKIAKSVQLAIGNLAPASIRAALGRETTLPFNRRFHMKDGGFGWNPGKLNPNILRTAGPIDPDVSVVAFESKSGVRIATYVNFAIHLDTVGGLEISADFPHTLEKCLAEIHGQNSLTAFTMGCAGDINHIDVSWRAPQKGHSEAARIGTVLAGAVVQTMPKLKTIDTPTIQSRKVIAKLDLAPITEADVINSKNVMKRGTDDRSVPFLEIVKAYQVLDVHARKGRPIEAEVQVISLGNEIAWVGLPGEIFVELGIALKRASPFKHTIISTLSGGSVGYVPTRQAYTQGQYEVITARVKAGSGEKLVETAASILRQLYTKSKAEK